MRHPRPSLARQRNPRPRHSTSICRAPPNAGVDQSSSQTRIRTYRSPVSTDSIQARVATSELSIAASDAIWPGAIASTAPTWRRQCAHRHVLTPNRSLPPLATAPTSSSHSAAIGKYTARERPASFLCGPYECLCSVWGSSSLLVDERGFTHQKSKRRPAADALPHADGACGPNPSIGWVTGLGGPARSRIAENMMACIPARTEGHAPATTKRGTPRVVGTESSATIGAQPAAIWPRREPSHAYCDGRFLFGKRLSWVCSSAAKGRASTRTGRGNDPTQDCGETSARQPPCKLSSAKARA
eukprot:scaffold80322_cov26-Tisochrysis_lutea.AAC.4